MRTWAAFAAATLLVIAACGDDDQGSVSPVGTEPDASAGTAAATLPDECTRPPFTVTAQRDGATPAGAAELEVVSTAGLAVPLVPNADQSLPADEVMARGGTTDLLGYVVIFGDEAFGADDISLFGGYEPEAAGKIRGAISIFPDGGTPLTAGQVLTPAPLELPNLFTTLNRVTLDLKAAPGEVTMYLADLQGEVEILALSGTSICLGVDLRWDYTDGGAEPDGTLTVKGTFTADLGPRTLPFT